MIQPAIRPGLCSPETASSPPNTLSTTLTIEGIALDIFPETDLYTSETFGTLIEHNFKRGIPYFVVTWGNKSFADAASFMSSYYGYGHKRDPLRNDINIEAFRIYKLSPNKPPKSFADKTTIRNSHSKDDSFKDFYAKYIGASSSEVIGCPKERSRGEQRFYMASYYTTKEESAQDEAKAVNYFKKAQRWLDLAIQDDYPYAKLQHIERLYDEEPEKALIEFAELIPKVNSAQEQKLLRSALLDMLPVAGGDAEEDATDVPDLVSR